MDPIWAAFAEFWWIGPAVIGTGTLGWMGLRGQRGAKARRLAYDASVIELKAARQDAAASRIAVRVARAELARAQAERAAGRASAADVAAARKVLDAAQRDTRAAAATMRVRRATLSADRAALSAPTGRGADPAQLPLGRLMATDDAVTARWMDYETDAAKVIAFPAMSDARVPATAAFLAELRTVRALRPASADARITPGQFAAYRDGVARLSRALDVAEAEAWRRARAAGSAPAGPGPDTASAGDWTAAAQDFAATFTQTVLARGAEALARATAPRAEQSPPTAPKTAPADPAEPTPKGDRGPEQTPPWQWPIPSRASRPARPPRP